MHNRILLTVLTLALITNGARRLPAGAGPQEVDVVVNKANNIASFPREEVRRIFLGEKTFWPDGKRITVLMLSRGQPERELVLREVYKMNEADYTRYFLQAAFTGRVQAAPRELLSPAEMKSRLGANPNAIGYLKKGDVDDSFKVLLKMP
jgi:ABC-type phosphate transport system substrate-binding protein